MKILTNSQTSTEKQAAQLLFDFNSSYGRTPKPKNLAKNSDSTLLSKEIKRSVLAWVVGKGVNGVGFNVVSRIKRFKADIAAFWSDPKPNPRTRRPSKILRPVKTVMILCRKSREECWPDCSRSEHLLQDLSRLKKRRSEIETYIRNTEPHLRQNVALFQEFNDWDYDKSKNPEYHSLTREIQATENAIYKGSKFERMQTAMIANQLMLAVPEKTVEASEVADGWGLLWVKPDRRIEVVLPAKEFVCPDENCFHLVQNIASANIDEVLFHQGIQVKENKYQFSRFPRSKRFLSTSPQVTYEPE